jgi:exopolysaccharide production protein ExoQ
LNIIIVLLILLIWPLAIAVIDGKINFLPKPVASTFVLLGLLAVFSLAVVIQYSSGVIALTCGGIAAGAIWFFGRRAVIAASVLLVVIGLALPVALVKSDDPTAAIKKMVKIPFSAEHRLKIWEFTANKIEQKPALGWGMNASENIPGGNATLYADTGQGYGRALPLHPHNAILQMWLELGLPGILFYLGLIVLVMMGAVSKNKPRFHSSMMMGQVCTTLVIANLSFGVWQAWWIATLWLAVLITVMISSELPKVGQDTVIN